MSAEQPFSPKYGSNQIVTIGAAASVDAPIDASNQNVRILNTGVNIAHVRVMAGTGTAATAADYPIGAGQDKVITKAIGQNNIACYSLLGTTLQVMTGEGW